MFEDIGSCLFGFSVSFARKRGISAIYVLYIAMEALFCHGRACFIAEKTERGKKIYYSIQRESEKKGIL